MGRTVPAVAVLLALTAGCAAPAPSSSSAGGDGTAAGSTAASTPSLSVGPAVPPVAGIEAEAVRLRTDEAVGGQVQVRITATGDEPFTVTVVALDSPGFAAEPPREASTEFRPGRTIDLPVRYGAPRCDSAAEPAAARLTVVRADGTSEEVLVPLAAEVLTRIHEDECAVLALLQVVDVAVVDAADTDDAVTAQLRLTRRTGSEPVSVERVGGSVLIDVAAPDLRAVLEEGEEELSTPVTFTPATCEAHVLAETKKPYVFPLEVRAGTGAPVVMDVPVDDGLRARLAALVDRVCLAR